MSTETLDKAMRRDLQASKMMQKYHSTKAGHYLAHAAWKLAQAQELYFDAGYTQSALDCAEGLHDITIMRAQREKHIQIAVDTLDARQTSELTWVYQAGAGEFYEVSADEMERLGREGDTEPHGCLASWNQINDAFPGYLEQEAQVWALEIAMALGGEQPDPEDLKDALQSWEPPSGFPMWDSDAVDHMMQITLEAFQGGG